jgi:hypothetical protein
MMVMRQIPNYYQKPTLSHPVCRDFTYELSPTSSIIIYAKQIKQIRKTAPYTKTE